MAQKKKKEDYYLERDISWMYFNRRILQEATRPHVPLLERMTFLGIYSNNLDEFFRVRMATQNRIAECMDRSAVREREHAKKLIKQISKLNARYVKEYEETVDRITEELRKNNIYLVSDKEVSPEQLDFIRAYYKKNLSGLMIPVWFSAVKLLDSENDENIYLAVKVADGDDKRSVDYAYIELPVNVCGRFVRLPDCGHSELKYPAWPPVLKKELDGEESLLEKIRQKDRFIHVPFHHFDSFIRVLQEAAVSKQTHSIKITLYRLAKESKVVKALIAAARNGKKVTVVIELLARFDEASNITWSKKMQDAGIKVIFGVEGLKVHSKITHIGMKKGPDIACISTGNFHEGNARMYTDCVLMTALPSLVKEVNTVFDFIERPYSPVRFRNLLVSPNEMKKKFVALINEEIKNKRAGKPAYIKIKINHITDPVMVEKLYEASQAGVDVDLVVRGNCSLMTGIHGVSDHIRIHGIIDRYLEHSRIFVFAAGGDEKVFLGSADWMPRNLDHRIEVITPVYDPVIKGEMKRIVEYGLLDNVQGRIVDGTGENRFWEASGESDFRSQEALYKYYLAENEKI